MDKLICELTITTNKIVNDRVHRGFLYEFFHNLPEIHKIKLQYKYAILFRIDEGRFYYYEEKPEVNDNNEIVSIKKNYIHTKNGISKSLMILKNIADRTKIICPEYTVKLTNKFNNDKDILQIINFFSKFDKSESNSHNSMMNETIMLKF